MDGSALASKAEPSLRTAATERELLMLGQPTLQEYLDFVRDRTEQRRDIDPRALCDEWREANDYFYELEQSEAGLADHAGYDDLPSSMLPLAERLAAEPSFQETYDVVPTSFAIVELERVVAFQTRVNQDFVEAQSDRLGPTPDDETLFHFCLPLRQDCTNVQASKAGSRRYVFSSRSLDLRFLASALLAPDQVVGHRTFGPVAGSVGLMVGFGSNLLNVIRSDNRLVLNDGYHRACALLASGVRYAPCVVQTVTRRDELALIAPRRVIDSAAFYFKSARPPLLKDFFDPRIRKVLPVRPVRRVVEVSFEVREYDLDD